MMSCSPPLFDAEAWTRKLAGEGCTACALPPEADDADWLVTMASGRVRLQRDGDFRGYCILYHRRHVAELFELTPAERVQLIEDIARVAEAIVMCCRPAKLNYACLGNEVPHLHWHIVPRYPTDGWWGQAFTQRPASARRVLADGEYEDLRRKLRAALEPR